jgi:undecaprenyl diphosphate synthase
MHNDKENTHVPQHVAIICDGNRRWARSRGLKVFAGHKKAVHETFETLIDHAIKRGVKYLTFWIFSTENWKRDRREVDYLMDLFRYIFDKKIADWKKRGVRFNMIGDPSRFDQDIQERIKRGIETTKESKEVTVTLAMNYGGRDEIVRATKKIAQNIADKKLKPEEINDELFAKHLDTADLPDPELIIRTGGEQRMSGFMLWQQQYSEFFFSEFNFPDFTKEKFDEILDEFINKRQRRFGGG